MADKELRIRMTLDKGQFEQGIHSANQGLKETKEHLGDGASAASSMGKAMLAIGAADIGIKAVHLTVGAIAEGMRDAAAYTKQVAEDFAKARESMREIAAIQGKGLTNEFVGQQVDIAKQAQILTVEETATGVKAFQQYGSGYVGEVGPGKSGRVTQESVNHMLPTVLATAKRLGMKSDVASKLFASVLQTMPAGSSEQDYMDMFAKMIAQSLDSKGSAATTAANLAPILAQFGGEGGAFGDTPEGISDAVKMVNTVSESRPGQSAMLIRNTMQELTRDDLQGKNDELGIEGEMTPMQKLKAMRDKFHAETGGKGNFVKWYAQKTGKVGNLRALEGLDVLIRKGIDGGFFARMDEKAKGASEQELKADLEKHVETQGGREDVAAAGKSIARTESGSRWADVETMKTEAEAELTRENAFEGSHPLEWLSTKLNPAGEGSVKERLIDQRALRNAQARAREAGVDAYTGPNAIAEPLAGFGDAENTIRAEIKRLVDLTAEANAQRSRQVPAVPAPMNGKPNVAAQMPR